MKVLHILFLILIVVSFICSCKSVDFKRIHVEVAEIEASPILDDNTPFEEESFLENWDDLSEEEKRRIFLEDYAVELIEKETKQLAQNGYEVKQVVQDITRDNILVIEAAIEFPESYLISGSYYSKRKAEAYLERMFGVLDGTISEVVDSIILHIELQYERWTSQGYKTIVVAEKYFKFTSATDQWTEVSYDEVVEEISSAGND